MRYFKVNITETLQIEVEIEAVDRRGAEILVEAKWGKSDYILDADHFKGVTFTAEPIQRNRDYER